ncbi:MAG: hypothetical protein M3354_02165 [Chloroflexota bacterium]|nr:hypothetical protein [Chloroflexota bacterium]
MAHPASVLTKGTEMRDEQPIQTQTMKLSDVKQQINRLTNEIVRNESRSLVEKSGIPVAAIVSTDDLRRLERLNRERTERFRGLDKFAAAFADQTDEQIAQETAKAIAEVRPEMRDPRQQAVSVKA